MTFLRFGSSIDPRQTMECVGNCLTQQNHKISIRRKKWQEDAIQGGGLTHWHRQDICTGPSCLIRNSNQVKFFGTKQISNCHGQINTWETGVWFPQDFELSGNSNYPVRIKRKVPVCYVRYLFGRSREQCHGVVHSEQQKVGHSVDSAECNILVSFLCSRLLANNDFIRVEAQMRQKMRLSCFFQIKWCRVA